MEDILAPLFNLLPALWEKRWPGLLAAWLIAMAGALGVLHYKDRYRASATVYVDTQTTLRPLLQGLAVQPDVGQQAAMLARTLLSPANIETIIDRNQLLPAGASRLKRELLIQRLESTIELKINGRDNLYTVAFVGNDPQKTLGVVRTIVDLFVQSGLSGSQQDSTHALRFIDSQIALYQTKLQDADSKLDHFRARHPEVSEQTAAALGARQSQLQDQLTLLQGQLAAAQTSRGAVASQLADVPPTLTQALPDTPGASANLGLDARIEAQRQRVDQLLRRYTEAYPDVVAARAELDRLLAQRRREGAASGTAAPHQRVTRADNPMYQQLKVNLAQADASVAALQSQITEVRRQLERVNQQVASTSSTDEYQQMMRQRALIEQNYQQLVQRRESAMLSRNQDLSRRSDDFRVVDPPRLAPLALFPRRTFLIALTLVVAIAVGVLFSYALVVVFPTYRTARELREGASRAVLGTVSWVLAPEEQARERWQFVGFAVASGMLVIGFAAWTLASMLHWIH